MSLSISVCMLIICLNVFLSGPVVFAVLIAPWTCDLVHCIYVMLSLIMFLSTTLFVQLVACLMVLVSCLLNAFAICLCVVAVLYSSPQCVRVLFVIPSLI